MVSECYFVILPISMKNIYKNWSFCFSYKLYELANRSKMLANMLQHFLKKLIFFLFVCFLVIPINSHLLGLLQYKILTKKCSVSTW